ncbi:MAG: type II toxin-antitoxin system PemK/MazF family toxin [Actinobacteria bacterium]|nr:type II toxin-antitoxin system PemK/MazF family toxin [Actinomycetota bacterium]
MADPSQTVGHEQSGLRPHLVLSVSRMNRSPLELVIALPLTTTDASNLLHVRIDPQPETGLTRVSYAMPEMVRSISGRRLGRPVGRVQRELVERAARHVGVLLGLGRTKF